MDEPVVDPVHGVRYSFEGGDEVLTVDTVMEPGGALPKHFHPQQEEIWWVISGEASFHLDGEWRAITPDSGRVTVAPGVVHGLRNESGAETHLRAEVKPPLGLRGFLTESAAAAREGLFARGGVPRSLRGAKWAAAFLERYEDQVVMTFPPRFVQRLTRPLARLG